MSEVFVCPNPKKWNEVYAGLLRAYENIGLRQQDIPEPPKPLILGGWIYSNDLEKQLRWDATVKWAEEFGLSQFIPKFESGDVYSVSEVTTHQIGPLGGPVFLPWNSEPRTAPTDDEVENALKQLTSNWEHVVGVELSKVSNPIRFSGKKRRRLVVGVIQNTKPAWGTWHSLNRDESRRLFTSFRKKVNDTIKPLEVDHIDFEPFDALT